MSGCKLIVHADDLGLSEKVNEGIVKAHLEGIVTSTSLMAVGAAFEHAVQLTRSIPSLDVGVHLTLTGEAPISKPADIPTLLNMDGLFYDHANAFTKRYLLRKIAPGEIRQELDAQIRRALDHGIAISHLDGHQHIHMLPGVRRIVGELAKRYAISSIRLPRERLQPYMLREKQGMGRLIQLLALNTFCALAKKTDARRPDRFAGFFFGGNLTEENLMKVLQHLPANGVCELMCHPGLHDADSRYRHWGYPWQSELDALTSPNVKAFLQSRGIELIPYSALTHQAMAGTLFSGPAAPT